jgi:hypothetical protein
MGKGGGREEEEKKGGRKGSVEWRWEFKAKALRNLVPRHSALFCDF